VDCADDDTFVALPRHSTVPVCAGWVVMNVPVLGRATRFWRWLRRSLALVIASVSAIIIGYAVGVFVSSINDSNSSAPPPAVDPTVDPASIPTRSSFPWLAIGIPFAVVVLIYLLRKRRPVRWLLHRAKAAAETYSLPIGDELTTPFVARSATPAATVAGAALAATTPEPAVVAPAAAAVETVSDDDSLISVLTFRHDSAGGGSPQRRMSVVRGLRASINALTEAIGNSDQASSPDRPIIDVVSVFAVDQKRLTRAYDASIDLGRWIETQCGLRLLAANGRPARVPQLPTPDSEATDPFQSVFFGAANTGIEMGGLIPLAVYARVDVTVAAPEVVPAASDFAAPKPATVAAAFPPPTPKVVQPVVVQPVVVPVAEPVVAAPVVAVPVVAAAAAVVDNRRIDTLFDMFNELLAIGGSTESDDSHLVS